MTNKELKKIREQIGWTVTKMAQELGVHRTTVAKYEKNLIKIPATIDGKISKILANWEIAKNLTLGIKPNADIAVEEPATTNEVVIETIYSAALRVAKQCEDLLCATMVALEKIENAEPEILEMCRGLEKAYEPISRYADKLEKMEANTLKLVKVVSR